MRSASLLLVRGSAALAAVAAPHRGFHSQHRTPIVPQVLVADPPAPVRVHVGYFLHRSQVVKHTPHPLEIEMSYLLEREHQRYSRHETTESATHFMAGRGQTMDLLNRTEPGLIMGNFFGLELYQDAMRVVMQRYSPERRVTAADLWDPEATTADGPPPRRTLHRRLDDLLFLIVQEEATGLWTVPHEERADGESLRVAADRAIATHHGDGLDCYVWSNAPQATVPIEDGMGRLFVYSATYLSGRPRFTDVQPRARDHAWVTRAELRQYAADFKSPQLLQALLDITPDSTFETS